MSQSPFAPHAPRLPLNGQLPTAALTVPDSWSPETVPENSSVSGMGFWTLTFQVAPLPESLPS